MTMGAKLIAMGMMLLMASGCSGTDQKVGSADPSPVGGLDSLNGESAGALDDGELSLPEYEAAFKRFLDCVVDEGAQTVFGPTWNESINDFEVVVGWPMETAGASQVDSDACWDAEVDGLQNWWVWQESGRPSEADRENERAEFEVFMSDCLSAAGGELFPPESFDEEKAYGSNPDMYLTCLDSFQAEAG